MSEERSELVVLLAASLGSFVVYGVVAIIGVALLFTAGAIVGLAMIILAVLFAIGHFVRLLMKGF